MNELYSSRLKDFRKSKKLTQLAMAEELGISSEHYPKIENNYKNPSMQVHIDLCLKLEKPSDCFFNEHHHDLVLTSERINYLKSLQDKDLKILLRLLHMIYENKK